MEEFTPEQKKILRDVAPELLQEKDLPVYLELHEMNEKMDSSAEQDKEMCEEMKGMHETLQKMVDNSPIEIHKYPEPKEVNFSETNQLLQKMCDKMDKKDTQISVTLKIE